MILPVWALRLLPYGLAALALIGVVWYIDHRGYERAKRDAEVRQLADALLAERHTRRIEKAMATAVSDIDRKTTARLSEIDVTERTIVQPVIQREIKSDPRYSDPAAGISISLRDQLNAARRASNPAAPR